MLTIQRVRVRWSAASRGAPQADVRRGLARAVPLPDGDFAVHDVLFDEAAGYAPRQTLLERADDAGLALTPADAGSVKVDRLPGWEAYPRRRGPQRLFVLAPGETGRYRANYRFTHTVCPCDPSWYYEDWTVHVSNGRPGDPAHDVDHRVSLYGR